MVYVSKNNFAFAQTSQFVGSHMLMAQNDAQTIYAIGSRGWGREKGTSVYVSEDGGDNWDLRFLQMDWDGGFVPWSGSLLEHSQVVLNVGWYDGGYYTTGINQLNSGLLRCSTQSELGRSRMNQKVQGATSAQIPKNRIRKRHVMNRGRGRQFIFHNDDYYQAFLKTVDEAFMRFGCITHAYCLMGNHYHLH
jgi:hypothetical protein